MRSAAGLLLMLAACQLPARTPELVVVEASSARDPRPAAPATPTAPPPAATATAATVVAPAPPSEPAPAPPPTPETSEEADARAADYDPFRSDVVDDNETGREIVDRALHGEQDAPSGD
ncbi:MAG: hypothetical protein R3B72_22490 [Polyangiaceae bacterium]